MRPTLIPQAIVLDAHAVLEFVQEVLGAEINDLYEENDRVLHSEVMIGDSRLMIATASEDFPPFTLMANVYVDDVDATYGKAIELGATSLSKPEDRFYGDRTGGVIDSQGNQWWISTHIEEVSAEELRRRVAERSV